MNKTLLTILMFAALLLFIVSPFAGLAGLMLVLVVSGFITTFLTVIRTIVFGDTKSDSA